MRRPPSTVRLTAVLLLLVAVVALLVPGAAASLGDRLPEFRECVDICQPENCGPGKPPTPIPFHLRLLLWNCASECDQTCQHIITQRRVASGLPITQFHGKWPFYRLFGIQEPASVLFSLGNLWAHANGLRRLLAVLPRNYSLRSYYIGFGLVGMASWVFSSLFHTRDFLVTERLDYFAAGLSVLYGLYYTPIRVFRWDRTASPSLLKGWTVFCVLLYVGHVLHLLRRWDYTYNMAANVVCGIVQNALWTYFSWRSWQRTRRAWSIWPGLAVAWVMLAMGLELFDFPPLAGILDAHSLWHAATIAPTILWYTFLIKDSQDDIAGKRLKE